ncbi:hypothetical protein cgR_0640 [Corynebacterium glutamicum R]|uniref:Uncharacterized protein n=1 Tax=Corynebacterium glutamicum (strain R) TaxID=340322 RepID=A0AB72V8K8_CORGB|nr:hypothetical protein cgR_0640 [Corynebacterium glutamicum R]
MELNWFAHCYLLPRHFFDDDQVANCQDHATYLWGIGTDHGVADSLQTEGTKIVAMLGLGAHSAFDLSNLQRHFLRLLTCACTQNTCWCDLFDGLATAGCNLFRADQLLQAVHSCVDDVDSVVRAKGLGQDVLDTCALKNWTCCATGYNTGTWSSWLQHNDAGCLFALNWVGDGAVDHWDAEEVLTSLFCTLLDCGRDFLGLAVTDTDHSLAVANDDKCGEAEATTTLDDLGHTVDGDYTLDVL